MHFLTTSRIVPRLSSLSQRSTTSSLFQTKRTLLTLKNHKYSANATAQGLGRNGTVSAGTLNLRLSSPTELGGTGDGSNPEQLFAMAYASCLLGAVQLMASRMGRPGAARDAVVHSTVHLGEPEGHAGLGIEVDMVVEGVDEEILQAGHAVCPYSRMLQHGAVVNVSTAPARK